MAHILVVGTGSIGAVYASILDRGGASVTCVCRSNYEAAKANGLRVKSSIFGELHTRPRIVQNVKEALSSSKAPFDFILVCTKAIPEITSAVIESIQPVVKAGSTSIVIIQNGVGVERPYHIAFPDTAIISGVTYLPTEQVAPGVFSHQEIELLQLGLYPLPQESTSSIEKMNSFANQLKAGGATVEISKDIQIQRWNKIVANGAVNPICALSRRRDAQLFEVTPLAGKLFKGVMLEVKAVAAAAGYAHAVTAEAVEKQYMRVSTRSLPGVKPSMMADMENLRPMEVEPIVGELVRIAEEKEVKTPMLVTLLVLLRGLDFAMREQRKKS